MSKESIDPSQLFTVPANEFEANYRPLTPVELAKLGESPADILPMSKELKSRQEKFLKGTFKVWDKKTAGNAKIITQELSPAEQNWSALETDIDTDKFGELILNPEIQNLNFETAKVFIPDLSAFEGQKLSKLAEHLVSTYGDRYYLPDIEYWQWLLSNPDKSPKELEKNKLQFFFGSALRDSDGHWSVPYADWDGGAWRRRARWLDRVWRSNCRVVLLER